MAKAIVFDLDGVLVDSKEIHFNALNLALAKIDPKYIISQAEQDTTFEGLTTKSKLVILSHTKGLDPDLHEKIWLDKQKKSTALFGSVGVDASLVEMFKFIKTSGINIGVASNSIRATLDSCLQALGVGDLVDCSLSNEDVLNPKPNPEIYLKTFDKLGVTNKEAVVFEDSPIGLSAARASKAKTVKVLNRSDLNFKKIIDSINYLTKDM